MNRCSLPWQNPGTSPRAPVLAGGQAGVCPGAQTPEQSSPHTLRTTSVQCCKSSSCSTWGAQVWAGVQTKALPGADSKLPPTAPVLLCILLISRNSLAIPTAAQALLHTIFSQTPVMNFAEEEILYSVSNTSLYP